MQKSKTEEVEYPGKTLTIRGQKCSKWTEYHQQHRNDHNKIQLGTINPVHIYVDPRKEQEQIDMKPNTHTVKLQPKKMFEKPYLAEHLTNPYVHIKKVVDQVPNHVNTYADQNDLWNKSTNLHSTRQIYQIPKNVKSSLTKSCHQAIFDQAERAKSEKEQRDIIYNANQKFKEDIYKFYSVVKSHIDNKQFSQRFTLFLTRMEQSTEKLSSQNKQRPRVKFEDEKQQPALKQTYNLKQLWKLWANEQKLQIENKKEQEVTRKQFIGFILDLGYPESKQNEIELYCNYCNDEDEIEWKETIQERKNSPQQKESQLSRSQSSTSKDFFQTDQRKKKESKLNESQEFSIMARSYVVERKKKAVEAISMRQFLYNYDRFLQSMNKISYVFSNKAATERMNLLKQLVKIIENEYQSYKEDINKKRDLEDEAVVLLQNKCEQFDTDKINNLYSQLRTKEALLNADYRMNKEEQDKLKYEINQLNQEVESQMQLYQELYGLTRSKFEEIIQSRDNLFFQKRALTKFMKQCFQDNENFINLEILEKEFTLFYHKKNEEKDVIDKFCQSFLKEKTTFKENKFKLYEIATFVFDNQYNNKDNEVVIKFITKIKGNFNQSRNYPKNEYIDPNVYIDLDIFERTFQIYCEKINLTIEFLGGFYDQMEELYKQKQIQYRLPPTKSTILQRLTKVKESQIKESGNRRELDTQMEMNLILDYVMKQFQNYDKQIMESNEKLTKIAQYVTSNYDNRNLVPSSLELICQIKEEQLTLVQRKHFEQFLAPKQLGSDSKQKFNAVHQEETGKIRTEITNVKKNIDEEDDLVLQALNNNQTATNTQGNNHVASKQELLSPSKNKQNLSNKNITDFLNKNSQLVESTII